MSDIEIFLSYSHTDESLRSELVKHLSNLKRQGVIRVWHDRMITAGREWANQIDEHLDTATIILLLISADFMASDYCNDIEVQRALERHEAREARVIPVILRPVDWKGAIFEKLHVLPRGALPVTKWQNSDEAFVSIVEGIRSAIQEMKVDRLWLRLLAARQGEEDAKIELGEQILALAPDFQAFSNQSMRRYLAERYVSRGLEKQRSLVPSIDGAGLFTGAIYMGQKQRQKVYERALPDLNRAIELCPQVHEYYYYRGVLRSKSKSFSQNVGEVFDYHGAREDFTRAIELAPDRGGYYYARAALLNPELKSIRLVSGSSDSSQTTGQIEAEQDIQKAIQLGFLDPETRLPTKGAADTLRRWIDNP